MYFKGDYLRVLSPRTEDGNRPMLDETGKQIWKETSLPVTARPQLEARNRVLPNHLKRKIEYVSSGPVVDMPLATKENPVRKPGRPAKHAQTN